jgi:hypothetical protein
MCEFKVVSIKESVEIFGYLEYKSVHLKIPNLEEYSVIRESVLNFQHRLFNELENLFWDAETYKYPHIEIERNNSYYTYKIHITNAYTYYNISKLEQVVNYILSDFPFKYCSRKRKSLENIDSCLKKMRL